MVWVSCIGYLSPEFDMSAPISALTRNLGIKVLQLFKTKCTFCVTYISIYIEVIILDSNWYSSISDGVVFIQKLLSEFHLIIQEVGRRPVVICDHSVIYGQIPLV